MIILSGRREVGEAVLRLFQAPPEGVPRVCGPYIHAGIAAALRCRASLGRETQVLVVDVGDMTLRPALPTAIPNWRFQYPGTAFVYVGGVQDLLLAARLMRLAPGWLPDGLSAEVWYPMVREAIFGARAASMQADIVRETERLGRVVTSQMQVWSLLERAPAVTNIEQFCNSHGIERRSFVSRLRRGSRKRTAALLAAFRLLWAMKLQEEGWEPGDIARFMGFEDATAAARRLRSIWGIGKRELSTVPYGRFVPLVANWITEDGGLLGIRATSLSLTPLRARLRGLVSDAALPVGHGGVGTP